MKGPGQGGLKGVESCYENLEARKVETVLSASKAKTCYSCGETGHMAFKCPHNKNGFSARNVAFTCHFCGGIGHKYAKCWEREENARLRPEGWVSKMNNSAAAVATDIIVGNEESLETMEFVEQNDVVKVADSDFEICCMAIDLAEVVESEYDIHGKARECDDLVEVVESEYEIHVWACDSVVEVISGVP